MLNIGFITDNHYPRLGGMEYCTHYLAESLNGLNDINAVVSCSTLRGISANFKYSYPCYRSKSFSVLTPWLLKKSRERMIKRESTNILHGQMLHGGGYAALGLSKKFNIPFVAQSHGSDVQVVPEINYGAVLDEDKKKIIRTVINRADKLIAVSSMNKQNMVDLGAKPEQVEVIHNGIDIQKINKIPDVNLRSKWGIDDEDFVLISVGRNSPIKRLELLFQALEKLKDYKHIKCLCVGPKANLGEMVAKYDVFDKVILTGKIPELNSLHINPPHSDLINAYRTADLYISTSYMESFGSATAEALACGTPVIIGRNHGIKDVVIDGETGWIMPKETPSSLAELIINLYEQREVLKSNNNVIKNSVNKLSWDIISKQMADVYKNVL